jgi:hypothetical protein
MRTRQAGSRNRCVLAPQGACGRDESRKGGAARRAALAPRQWGSAVFDALEWIWSTIPRGTEFWSAITGALVGGMIAFVVQMIALRAAKSQRSEDYKLVQQGLGNSLLFKMIRIHVNFQAINRHIEACFEGAGRRGLVGEPWQFVLPLANPPNPIHFSSEEMGMLLAQKVDEVFNSVLSIDVLHNGLIDAVKTLNDRRMALTERIAAGKVEGEVAVGGLAHAELLAIRPRMIELNTLIEQLRADASKAVEESGDVLDRLHQLLREKLGLPYRLVASIAR